MRRGEIEAPLRHAATAGLMAFLLAAPLPAAADPRLDYVLHCRGCHGPDGAGIAGGAPSLRDRVARFLGVPGGREYLVRVPGTARSELDDARTAALLNWMLREFDARDVPPDFVPYTAAEAARLRRLPLTSVGATRRALIQEIDALQAAPSDPDPPVLPRREAPPASQ